MQQDKPAKHYHKPAGDADYGLRHAAELVATRAAGDMGHVVERLACCCSEREKSLVCLVYYRGLSMEAAAKMMKLTIHQAKDSIRSASKRYQAMTVTRKIERMLTSGPFPATAGDETTAGADVPHDAPAGESEVGTAVSAVCGSETDRTR